jgi:hypothetical protein
MAEVIGIMGPSGAGKSTSGATLSPTNTFWINADRKSLPFIGWRADYNEEAKNYIHESSITNIKKKLKEISANMPHIKVVVWDTVNVSMVDNEISKMSDKSFDKWADLASDVWTTIQVCGDLRPDLVVYMLFHSQSVMDDDGLRETKILTNGKKLNKIQLETKMTVLLLAKVKNISEGKNEYVFQTQSNQSTAKSPDGMFDKFEIPNNLGLVDRTYRIYNSLEPISYRKKPEAPKKE